MPTFQIGLEDGRSLRIEADSQEAALAGAQHFIENDKPAEPSGIAAGLAHGLSGVASGDASTIGLTGAPTTPLDAIAKSYEPSNYKSASLIREGGHWYNPADYRPSALPQILAEAAPGIGQDAAAGWAASKLAPGGAAVKAMAGLGGFAGSQLLRSFGPGAHANADARTGTPNSPVDTQDITREAAKQAIQAPINMIPASRFLPAVTKAGGSALAKYLLTAGEGAGANAASDAVEQIGTTAGSNGGIKYDPNRAVQAAASGAAGSALLASPRLAADIAGNAKYGKIEADPDTKAAATALANRYEDAADGRKLVGPLGGTKVAQEVRANVHGDVHSELADAAKNEGDLSQKNARVLQRIQDGGTATQSELASLSDEADPHTVHLARQALLSANVKDTGGISGAMDNLTTIKNPGKTILGTAAAVAAGHGFAPVLGSIAAPVLGGLYGGYAAARGFDKMTGARSPVQGFTNRFAGDPSVPSPTAAAPVVDNYNPSAGPWGARAPEGGPSGPVVGAPEAPQPKGPTPSAQNADIRGMLLMAAARRKLQAANEPVTADVPAPTPEAPKPDLSPVAMMMLKQKLKQGLPPEPAPAAPAAPPAPVISPIALKMVQQKMKQGLPDAPASPQIAQAMQTVAAHNAPPAPAAPAAPAPAAPAPAAPPPTSMANILSRVNGAPAAPELPQAPMIAKISKKLNGKVKETPHPVEDQPYTPLSQDELWGKGLSNEAFAEADAASKSDLKYPARYKEGIVRDRLLRSRTIGAELGDETGPDASHAEDLLQELHHIRRADKASGAIQHFTAKMAPAMRDAMRARLNKGFVNSIWSR